MDIVGVDSSSSSRSSPSSAGINMCTVEHRPEMLDSSNSSEASSSPNPLRSDSASSQRRFVSVYSDAFVYFHFFEKIFVVEMQITGVNRLLMEICTVALANCNFCRV